MAGKTIPGRQFLSLLWVTGTALTSAANSQTQVAVYMPTQNEINAEADCVQGVANVRSIYDPWNGYRLFEGAMAARDRGDFSTAVPLLERLAREGHAGAQYNLGVMYEDGEGMDQDLARAIEFYLDAANMGHIRAQFRLGSLYDDGVGVAENDEESVKWYLAAAEQGYLAAQMTVAASYALGEGVPENFVQTYMWFTIASKQVARGSMEDMLVRMALENAGRRLTRSQIQEAKKLAREWLAEHSNR